MTNGVLRDKSRSNSATKNDDTVVLFNLDRLNKDCPENGYVGMHAIEDKSLRL